MRWLVLQVIALAALVAPPALNVIASTATDWRASPRFDSDAYVLSDDDVVPQTLDSTGVAASLATLLRWRGDDADEAALIAAFAGDVGAYTLDDVARLAADHGLDGRWYDADVAALASLRSPFLASLREGGGRVLVVRRVAIGHVYAADPRRGNVLYPLERFVDAWDGRLFAFDEPPPQPAAWR